MNIRRAVHPRTQFSVCGRAWFKPVNNWSDESLAKFRYCLADISSNIKKHWLDFSNKLLHVPKRIAPKLIFASAAYVVSRLKYMLSNVTFKAQTLYPQYYS